MPVKPSSLITPLIVTTIPRRRSSSVEAFPSRVIFAPSVSNSTPLTKMLPETVYGAGTADRTTEHVISPLAVISAVHLSERSSVLRRFSGDSENWRSTSAWDVPDSSLSSQNARPASSPPPKNIPDRAGRQIQYYPGHRNGPEFSGITEFFGYLQQRLSLLKRIDPEIQSPTPAPGQRPPSTAGQLPGRRRV